MVPTPEDGGLSMADKMETTCPDYGGKVGFTRDDVARQRTVRCSRGHSVKLQDQGGGARHRRNDEAPGL